MKMATTHLAPNMKYALEDLIRQADVNYNVDGIIFEFSKPPENISKSNLIEIIKQITKNNSLASQASAEMSDNLNKYSPSECLCLFLGKYIEDLPVQQTIPNLCSTTIEEQSPQRIRDIKDIKKRLTQAAADGLSKSAQSTSVIEYHGLGTEPSAVRAISLNRKSSQWFLTGQSIDNQYAFQKNKIVAIPKPNQEQLLITELLHCLIGISSIYIKVDDSPPSTKSDEFEAIKFKFSSQIDVSLKDLCLEILPLASHYSLMQKFIQMTTLDCGQILQAFAAALSEHLRYYFQIIAQLEAEQLQGTMTLHKLPFYLRPIMNSMEVIVDVIREIWRKKLTGGRILSLLYEQIISRTGDANSQQILIYLTERSSAPYSEMLELWINKGVIVQMHSQEFFIIDNEANLPCESSDRFKSALYWERRYILRDDRVPKFLENVADIILRTGKYLNVLNQFDRNVSPTKHQHKLHLSPTNDEHFNIIKSAYDYASKSFLDLLMKEKDLIGHLNSIKRYMLLYQGDIVSQFLDISEEELTQPVDEVRPIKLESLLGLILRTSTAKHDPYKENLHCELFDHDLIKEMVQFHLEDTVSVTEPTRNEPLGVECFAFYYELEWPASLIVNEYAMRVYQMIFRELFFLKHVEQQLCKIWIENVNRKRYPYKTEQNRLTFSLRQQMMNVIQNILYYMTIEVIEPKWHKFIEEINRVENVDDLIMVQQNFCATLMDNLLLNNTTLLQIIIDLCHICLAFCKYTNQYRRGSLTVKKEELFEKRIKNFDEQFTNLIVEFLQKITHIYDGDAKTINLVHRINFNSFYSNHIEILQNQQYFTV